VKNLLPCVLYIKALQSLSCYAFFVHSVLSYIVSVFVSQINENLLYSHSHQREQETQGNLYTAETETTFYNILA